MVCLSTILPSRGPVTALSAHHQHHRPPRGRALSTRAPGGPFKKKCTVALFGLRSCRIIKRAASVQSCTVTGEDGLLCKVPSSPKTKIKMQKNACCLEDAFTSNLAAHTHTFWRSHHTSQRGSGFCALWPRQSQHAIDCSWLQSATHSSGRSESCSGRMCRLEPRRLALCGMSCGAFGAGATGCRSPAASGPWLRLLRIGSPSAWHWLALRFGCEPAASVAPPALLLP